MEIYLEKDNKTICKEIEEEKTIKEILNELNISVDSVIISKNGEIALEDETVSDQDKLKILSVISGG